MLRLRNRCAGGDLGMKYNLSYCDFDALVFKPVNLKVQPSYLTFVGSNISLNMLRLTGLEKERSGIVKTPKGVVRWLNTNYTDVLGKKVRFPAKGFYFISSDKTRFVLCDITALFLDIPVVYGGGSISLNGDVMVSYQNVWNGEVHYRNLGAFHSVHDAMDEWGYEEMYDFGDTHAVRWGR